MIVNRLGWHWPALVAGLPAAAFLAFALIIKANGQPADPSPAPALPTTLAVAVVESAASAAHFAALPGADPEASARRARAWRDMLQVPRQRSSERDRHSGCLV